MSREGHLATRSPQKRSLPMSGRRGPEPTDQLYTWTALSSYRIHVTQAPGRRSSRIQFCFCMGLEASLLLTDPNLPWALGSSGLLAAPGPKGLGPCLTVIDGKQPDKLPLKKEA